MINFIIGYLIVINIVPMILIYVDYTFKIKIKEDVLMFIYFIIGLIGGGIGIIITSQMFNYRRDAKIIKRWIPLILFVQVVTAFILVCKINEWELLDFRSN